MPELLFTLHNEAGLWLAGLAAVAGLALAWRWWFTGRRLRIRALQVLGYARPRPRPSIGGWRYVGLVGVAVLTAFFLSPGVPGTGGAERELSAPVHIVIEVGAGSTTVVVAGSVIEIRTVRLTPETTAVVPVTEGSLR